MLGLTYCPLLTQYSVTETRCHFALSTEETFLQDFLKFVSKRLRI